MITEYPLHIDVFALFIFLGAVQGIFLSYFFLSKRNRNIKANVYLGFLLLATSLLCLDILFSYTNFMFQVIYLVDSTEPLNFIVGPLFYLYITAKIDESKIKNAYYHFLPFFTYLIYSILFHLSSTELKYNSYLNQYHPEIDKVRIIGEQFVDPLYLKSLINEFAIISIGIYIILASVVLYRSKKSENSNPKRDKLFKLLWFDVGLMTSILIIIVFVKSYFTHDFGDYIIIIALCIFIYSVTINIIRGSVFFAGYELEKKYSKSALDEATKEKILEKVTLLMDEKYYMNNSPSLPDLAKKIKTSPNYVSQVINEKLNITFLEMINKYRIEEAKSMILDEELNETIEGIAYSVGFNSKSTFNTAFKKFTGQTPTQYKDAQN